MPETPEDSEAAEGGDGTAAPRDGTATGTAGDDVGTTGGPRDATATAGGDVGTASGPRDDGADVRRRMETALREVRREGLKAAAVHAVVEGAAAFLGANLLLAALDPGWLPDRVGLPGPVRAALEATVGWTPAAAPPGSAFLAAVLGVLVVAGELRSRTRRPLVEQFEAANPAVAASLRTARDAVAADADSRMARRLYHEVLADLRDTSGLELVDWRRVGAALAVVVVASVATVQVAALDVALVGGPAPATNGTADERVQNYTGLRDGDAVLGAPEAVAAGNETLTARVESSGGGRDVDGDRQFPPSAGGDGGDGDASDVEGQQAGFAAPEAVEDADLVREYNRRIREADASGEADDPPADADEEGT